MTKRAKGPAFAVPVDREEAERFLRDMGEMQRELRRLQADLDDEVAAIKRRMEARAAEPGRRIAALQAGLEVWANANRAELLGDGKGKSVRLANGEIGWRTKPQSVRVTDEERVIEALIAAGLTRMVRTTRAVNRDVILADPTAVADIAGLAIVRGKEAFSATPTEVMLSDGATGGAR